MTRWLLVLTAACVGPTGGGDDTDVTDTDDSDPAETDDSVEPDDTDPVETDETDPPQETDAPGCLDVPTRLVLGTGERFPEFAPLTGGQTMQMVNGPQGGWHLTLAVDLENVEQLVVLRFVITDLVTGLVASAGDPLELGVALTPSGGVGASWTCAGRHTNILGILDFSKLGALPGDLQPWRTMCGHRARIDAEVLSAEDVPLVTESIEVLVQPDPENGAPCAEVVAAP